MFLHSYWLVHMFLLVNELKIRCTFDPRWNKTPNKNLSIFYLAWTNVSIPMTHPQTISLGTHCIVISIYLFRIEMPHKMAFDLSVQVHCDLIEAKLLPKKGQKQTEKKIMRKQKAEGSQILLLYIYLAIKKFDYYHFLRECHI